MFSDSRICRSSYKFFCSVRKTRSTTNATRQARDPSQPQER